MNYDRPGLRDRLAAEYVLGTLHGGARKRFRRLIKADRKVRVAVELWEQQLMPMGAPLSGPAPAAHVWQGIEARIARAARRPGTSAPGFFERWFGLRTLGALAAGVVIGVGAMFIAGTFKPPTDLVKLQLPDSYAGILSDDKGNAGMLISSLRHGMIVDIKVTRPVKLEGDQILQLWALEPGKAPLLLGTVPATGKGRLTLAGTSEQWLSKVTELAVSVEPHPGARGGVPNQPYLLRGPCAKFW
jgi:anti-sigma-K factor RskA